MKHLVDGSIKLLATDNAGGSSVWSEVFSFEVLNALFKAKLNKTEMEIEYFPMGGKITDFSIILCGKTFGVSVTRAMVFKNEFDEEKAAYLLNKKLKGIIDSTKFVTKNCEWKKQILHIWAQNEKMAIIVKKMFNSCDSSLKQNSLLIISICPSIHSNKIFYN